MPFKRFLFILIFFIGVSVWTSACGQPESTTIPQLTSTNKPPTSTQIIAQETLVPTPTNTATPTQTPTPSGNIDDYTVSDPGNVLLDPDMRRQYLETIGWPLQNELCIPDPSADSLKVVELDPIIYFERGLNDDTRWSLIRAMMLLSAEYLGTNNDEAAIAIIDTLKNWASANALSSLGGADFRVTVYDVKKLVIPTLASYSLVRDHPYLSSADRELIEDWLAMVVRQVSIDLTDNNMSYMRFAIDMEWGALVGDDVYFKKGVEGYISALAQMRPDGSFPLETGRGAMATHYTSHAISSLVLMAEIVANQGHNLYDLEYNDLSLHSAIAFLLDAMDDPEIIIKYASDADPCSIPEVCGDHRIQFMELYMGWIEAYRARFPESENAKRIDQMFEEGVLEYFRWQDDKFSMIYPNALDGAVTRCLFANVAPSLPVPTPVPAFSQQAYELGLIIYDDRFIKPWSCNADGEFQESNMAFQGEESIQVTLVPDGAVYFNNNRPPYIPFYTWLAFYFNGGAAADQQLYVEMKAGFRMPDREVELGERLNLLDYIEDSPLQPWRWYHVAIPLSLLDPRGKDFVWIEIGDSSGNGASTFFIDDIRFVP